VTRVNLTARGLLAGALVLLSLSGLARAEEPKAKAEEELGRKVVKRIVKVRAPSWLAKGGFLGVELVGLNRELRAFFKAPEDRGVLIRRVEAGSPAAKAGLRVGDVLTALDGAAVGSTREAIRLVREKPAGYKARLELVRDGKPLSLTAELEVRERTQVELSKVFHLSEDEAEGEEIELDLEGLEGLAPPEPPEPPAPPGHRRMLIFKGQGLDPGEREQLELRLRELEEKLRQLEEKLQGRAGAPAPPAAPT
jgi:membrane-associated protease RseP (regulator of RpoE activity)